MTKRNKPTQLKIIEGNPGKRPLPDDEPKPRPTMPECPDGLDDGAKEVWSQYAPIIHRMGLLTEVDGESFGYVCQIMSRIRFIWSELKKPDVKPMVIYSTMDSAGNEHVNVKLHPLLVEERHLMEKFRMWASEFGLTPRGRTGLSVRTKKKKSELEDLLD